MDAASLESSRRGVSSMTVGASFVARAQRTLRWLWSPSDLPESRELVGTALMAMGVVRFIDFVIEGWRLSQFGEVLRVTQLSGVPSHSWAFFMVVMGVALVVTADARWRFTGTGRVVAALGCGFCFSLAVATLSNSATSTVVAALFSRWMFLETRINVV